MLFWIILATLLNSLIGLIGIFSLFVKEKHLKKIIYFLVSFAAGALISGGLYHLLLESLEEVQAFTAFNIFLLGFLLFFFVERFLNWRHCHEVRCKVHPFGYLILAGDSIHNFIDGVVIASSFMVDFTLGVFTTILIIIHEVPQELGNFATAVYGGLNKRRAIILTFLAQATSILGGLFGFFVLPGNLPFLILPFAAGGFFYIATSDLIPRLHRERNLKKNLLSLLFFFLGLFLLLGLKLIFE
ncbi:MAG: ZIP family metal transporter [Candidatus Aenigmarchaeota archaeon]|nr:ZIP family metal transporter [Candidatus Aenigmarchaeota archaeon]MCX8190687.1 ZIP family metal transporter [Candidatus Aenigmarchaeota archaeon]MDW8159936.1 ZIP family metal transporter [Candidatus Aenigmarchaeota archaeon]